MKNILIPQKMQIYNYQTLSPNVHSTNLLKQITTCLSLWKEKKKNSNKVNVQTKQEHNEQKMSISKIILSMDLKHPNNHLVSLEKQEKFQASQAKKAPQPAIDPHSTHQRWKS